VAISKNYKRTRGLPARLFWPLAGVAIGLLSALGAWFNIRILVGSGDLTLFGVAIVTAEYAAILTALGWVYDRYISRS